MEENLKTCGVISPEEFKNCKGWPSEERFLKGPVAILECIEEIPCNPCECSCPKGAIYVGHPITNLPTLDESKCVGCKSCIASCPGLAIFVEDHTFSDKEALVSFPFEFIPCPKKGEKVSAVNRKSEVVCPAIVHDIYCAKSNDATMIVTLRVDKQYVHQVRSCKMLGA